MDVRTHMKASNRFVGRPIEIRTGESSRAVLKMDSEMAVDDKGLIHGGFVFSLADYAAMIAVNEPNVVLACANVRFIKPVKVGDEMMAEANVVKVEGRKRFVNVKVSTEESAVFEGEFLCVVLERHVLEGTV